MKHQIIGYFRYKEGILIIYNRNKTNIDETLTEFSKQITSIKFSVEKENTTPSVSWILQYNEKEQN
jgi:hypothetical protein